MPRRKTHLRLVVASDQPLSATDRPPDSGTVKISQAEAYIALLREENKARVERLFSDAQRESNVALKKVRLEVAMLVEYILLHDLYNQPSLAHEAHDLSGPSGLIAWQAKRLALALKFANEEAKTQILPNLLLHAQFVLQTSKQIAQEATRNRHK